MWSAGHTTNEDEVPAWIKLGFQQLDPDYLVIEYAILAWQKSDFQSQDDKQNNVQGQFVAANELDEVDDKSDLICSHIKNADQ